MKSEKQIILFLLPAFKTIAFLPQLVDAPIRHWRWIIWQVYHWYQHQTWARIYVSRANDALVIWTTCQPSAKSAVYNPRFLFPWEGAPRVYLERDEIVANAPYYLRDKSIGVYHPDDGWYPEKPFIETMFPWLAVWAYLYEIWLVTDTWYAPMNGG